MIHDSLLLFLLLCYYFTATALMLLLVIYKIKLITYSLCNCVVVWCRVV